MIEKTMDKFFEKDTDSVIKVSDKEKRLVLYTAVFFGILTAVFFIMFVRQL